MENEQSFVPSQFIRNNWGLKHNVSSPAYGPRALVLQTQSDPIYNMMFLHFHECFSIYAKNCGSVHFLQS